MREYIFCMVAAIVLSATISREGRGQQFISRARIDHRQTSATLIADSPRPLEQAITAVREEYGWVVSYEDPRYQSAIDLVEDPSVTKEWRASHFGGLRFLIPAGGLFQSTYPEQPDLWVSTTGEEAVLDKVVSDYNDSKNPGKFVVRRQSDGSFTVVGVSVEDDNRNTVSVTSPLDEVISIAKETRSAGATIKAITSALTMQGGARVLLGVGPNNVLAQSQVTAGGTKVLARELLLQVIAGTGGPKLLWELLYNHDGNAYYLNLLPAERASYDAFGRTRLEFVR